MRNLGVVTSFTINEMVKRKSFVISTIVILLMIVSRKLLFIKWLLILLTT